MLCLKAEVLDDHDANSSSVSTTSNNSGGGFGFILPINLGSSIHKYLWKSGRLSNRSISSGDGCPHSSLISDFEDIKPLEKRSGQLKGGNMSLYKYQLEEDVKKLRQQLQEEIDLRLALASAIEHSDSSFSSSPCQLPDKAQEILDSIAILEITVSKLEEESIALQYQLSQEKNERHLAEWRLRHLACPSPSPLDSSEIRRPSCGDNVEGKVDDKPLWEDINEELKRVHFVEKLWHHPNRLSKKWSRA
ncbi:hypothetical protein GH714_037907 [Hevea brasiliensis]|uniref:Ternary complex factor MIP1 leucine-zipper domain-containing protein n=1 Tax=Hevea brasiliensis TaxID=3981 RepID=A0A6A6K9K8_HEVBR|nr:hypothetical protein GH714_037907 [Hevea brasiliensis]